MLGHLSDGASGWSSPFVDGAGAFAWVIHGWLAWALLIACVHSGMGVLLCGGTWFGWYIVAVVCLFATLLVVMWHLESKW